jgi:uncharacterized protein YfaS (alpha-2-macroglobulin family)
VREGDTLELPVKVSSLSDSALNVTATIKFNDALTGKDITADILKSTASATFKIAAGQSSFVAWKIVVPRNMQAISFTASAYTSNHSDAETMEFPVLSDRMLITETLPFSLRPNQSKQVTFTRMQQPSSTAQNHRFTFEYTANPAWYAVQALPYLMEYPYECSEQVFSRYYANTLASAIANSSKEIRAVFDQWKRAGKESFLSNLEKNPELKNILLEESPWVREAAGENEQRQRIGLLFDLNRMADEKNAALDKLLQLQSPNGGWSWFKGMPDDRYITQYIIEGFGHLNKLTQSAADDKVNAALAKAIRYSDQRMVDDYQQQMRAKADSKNTINSRQIHYLYARSFYPSAGMESNAKKAIQYFQGQAKKYWLEQELSLQAMIAITLFRNEDAMTANDIIRSLRERSKTSEELGMYWPSNESGFSWSQAPVETQCMLIEAFNEIAKDGRAADEMRLWLLKNKQTTSWKTTKATAEACYALLLGGSNWLNNSAAPVISVGGQKA